MNDVDEVYENIYLGSIQALEDQQAVHETGISAIVRLDAGGYGTWHPDQFTVLHRHFPDGDSIPDGIIPQVTGFMHRHLSQDKALLVHCAMGVSRSTSLVIAYLIEYEGMSLPEAFGTLREARPIVRPHHALLTSLIEHYNLPYHPLQPRNPNFISNLMQDV